MQALQRPRVLPDFHSSPYGSPVLPPITKKITILQPECFPKAGFRFHPMLKKVLPNTPYGLDAVRETDSANYKETPAFGCTSNSQNKVGCSFQETVKRKLNFNSVSPMKKGKVKSNENTICDENMEKSSNVLADLTNVYYQKNNPAGRHDSAEVCKKTPKKTRNNVARLQKLLRIYNVQIKCGYPVFVGTKPESTGRRSMSPMHDESKSSAFSGLSLCQGNYYNCEKRDKQNEKVCEKCIKCTERLDKEGAALRGKENVIPKMVSASRSKSLPVRKKGTIPAPLRLMQEFVIIK